MHKLKTLVVDDDAFIRAMLSEVLNGDRFAVTTAENGKAAFEKFVKAGDFELIVANMNMPVMDGLGLIKALRRRSRAKSPSSSLLATTRFPWR
ncbi:MAG: response regulator [Nitrospinae bacterium]|nr:response regulator [Nitrospinota bacterium]